MSKQYNKAEKRQRRNAYLKRKRLASRAKPKPEPAAKTEAPTA
jgi:hypothetical protein